MNSSDIQGLVERLEKASGPDRELDAAIFNAFPDPAFPRVAYRETNCVRLAELGREPRFHDGWLVGKNGAEDRYPSNLLRYTDSIDAALTLVPPDQFWFLAYGRQRPDEPLGAAQIVSKDNTDEVIAEAEAVTVPLSICIASLRALASKGGATEPSNKEKGR